MGCSRDSYRPLAHWHADGRCRDFFDEQEVPSQSTSGSVKDEPSNHECMRDQLSEGKEGVDTAEPIVSDDDSEAPSETESYLDLVALDVPCHHCRRKNRYAKMKCTNILGEGNVCQMEFCHMCIYQRFLTFRSPLHPLVDVSPQNRYPNIDFEPFCRTFVCPRCRDACNCTLCCNKRHETYAKTPKRHRPPPNFLFLSELGRRQQEAAQKQGEDNHRRPGPKPASTRKRAKSQVLVKPDIGSEAQEWISSHLAEFAPSGSRVQRPRTFVGEWKDGWGRMASNPASISMVCIDIPAASSSDPSGKGKGRAIEPLARMYIGDREGLYKAFVSMDDVEEALKTARRTRKPSAKARGDNGVEDVKPRKRKRGQGKAHEPVPEFTINHQGSHLSITELSILTFKQKMKATTLA